MRLLDTHTGHFVEFYDTTNIRYAILSHMWDLHGEQTYQDVREIQKCYPIEAHGTSGGLDPPLPDSGASIQAEHIPGFWDDSRLSEKIRKACEIARSHGFRYLWIDSCCIDKASSSELSEAINSMYAWYGRAAMCFAFLRDVPQDDPESGFRRSRWFRRGWTLQELIAPRRLIFLSRDWQTLGSKSSMAGLVEQITRIDRKVLTHQLSLDKMSVAQRMSWAAERETTRVEDRAYSLLGIFDLNMPTLYGEGERAFRRLQEEIMRRIPDQTLFSWNEPSIWPSLPIQGDNSLLRCFGWGPYTISSHTHALLASSPSSFIHAGSVGTTPEHDYLDLLGLSELPYPDYSPSPYGIRSTFPVIPLVHCSAPDVISVSDGDISDWYLVVLSCHRSRKPQSIGPHLPARLCRIASSLSSTGAVLTVGSISASWPHASGGPPSGCLLFTVTANQLKSLRRCVEVRSVYLPYPDRASPSPSLSVNPSLLDRRVALAPSSYTSAVLRANGYEVEFYAPQQMTGLVLTHSLILRRHDRVLQINIDEVQIPPFHWSLSAVAWSFAVAEAQLHDFPLSTSPDPHPHDAVVYSYDRDRRFPTIILSGGANRSDGVTVRLELEEASGDASTSHHLHVDVEELDDCCVVE